MDELTTWESFIRSGKYFAVSALCDMTVEKMRNDMITPETAQAFLNMLNEYRTGLDIHAFVLAKSQEAKE